MSSVTLLRPKHFVLADLTLAEQEGRDLEQGVRADVDLRAFREAYLAWEAKTAAILEASFKVTGFLTPNPRSEFTGTAVTLLDLKLSATTLPASRLPEVLTDVGEKCRVLRSVMSRLDIYAAPLTPPGKSIAVDPNGPIFLVHGRDVERREVVRRFLETITDTSVIVLADQPNRGQDLLSKLLSNAQAASFAVILLSADDVGSLQGGDTLLPRARQNVVFELGLFIALLGRDRVAALTDERLEVPTDFSGVAYIPISGEAWQVQLARELKAAGVSVSLDRAI